MPFCSECTLLPQSYSNEVFLLSKMHLQSQHTQMRPYETHMCLCTLNYSKQTLFNSNQAFFNSNVPLRFQYIQIKPSTTQMCLYTLCTLKWGLLQFICAMASSIYLNWAFFNSNVPDCTQPTQIISFSIQMALIASNVHSYIQHLQMRSSRTQRTLILSNVHNLHSTPSNQVIIFKDAQMYSTNSNHH